MTQRRAAVAGAGIGGLAAALALAQRGWRVSVFEEAARLGEVGAGLQMSPNACHVLGALGVLEAVERDAVAPEAAVIRDGMTGKAKFRLPLGEEAEARYGAPYLLVHRADLHAALLGAAEEAGVKIVTGRTVSGYETGPDTARLLEEDAVAEEADIVIAADGVRSAIRAQMKADGAPVYMSHAAWRAVVPASALEEGLLPQETASWAGKGGHLVTYPLRRGALINVVAVIERPEWTEEGWRQRGDPAELRAAFRGWHEPLGALLNAVRDVHLWGLFARPPLYSWTDGRVALLGDAAHPMLPFMAQGAAMALEDAYVLADALEGRGAEEGLSIYEGKRAVRAARVQALSRANARRFHGGAWGRLQLAVGSLIPALPRAMAGQVYGVDVTQ